MDLTSLKWLKPHILSVTVAAIERRKAVMDPALRFPLQLKYPRAPRKTYYTRYRLSMLHRLMDIYERTMARSQD